MTQQPPPTVGRQPNSHLLLAILATIFCFPITGIVAIVKAAQVNGFWVGGNYAGAEASSKSAMKWIIWSVVIWALIGVAIVALSAAGVLHMDVDTTTS